MANRQFHRMQALQKEVKKLQVKVSTDGSADVVSSVGTGIASVAHAANAYTVTLEDKYNDIIGVSVIGGVSASWHVDSADVKVAKTVVVESSAAQASTEIYIELTLKNTSVVK